MGQKVENCTREEIFVNRNRIAVICSCEVSTEAVQQEVDQYKSTNDGVEFEVAVAGAISEDNPNEIIFAVMAMPTGEVSEHPEYFLPLTKNGIVLPKQVFKQPITVHTGKYSRIVNLTCTLR